MYNDDYLLIGRKGGCYEKVNLYVIKKSKKVSRFMKAHWLVLSGSEEHYLIVLLKLRLFTLRFIVEK